MQTLAARHQSQLPFTPFGISLILVAFFPLVLCLRHIEHVVLLILEALALFTLPLCVLAYHSHAQMQKKWFRDSDASFAPFPFPPLPPFPDCSRVFSPPEALVVPEKKNEGGGSFVTCAQASSCTYVPTIPRVPVFPPHSRRVPAPAPLPLPPSPLVAENDDYVVGPLHPVLTDGKHRFHVEGLIAAGGYGRVALATVEGLAAPASQVAIKVYCKDKLIANRLLHETYDLERSIMLGNTINDCQWLVKLRGIIFDPEISPLPRKIVRHWVEELALGLYELYDQSIVHCDLKPGNILVSPKGHLAIADFGISMIADDIADAGKPLDECKFFSYGGTYAYQAPELLISHHGASFTCAADMWSYGVIIFEMYTSRRLFSADAHDVRNEVWAWDIPAIVRSEIDDILVQDLVIALLEIDPEKRLKLRDLWEHPYFNTTNWRKVANKSISIDIDEAELSSCSWRDSLRFERPTTPDCLPFEPS